MATREEQKENGLYLVLNGGDVAILPPVQSIRSLQEVGRHEQGPLACSVSFVLVAVHDLSELLVCLWRQKVK